MSKLWLVGSGKGGCGKTFVATNLAITLTKTGQSVLIIDADLSGANINTVLGEGFPQGNLSDFLHERNSLRELARHSLIPRLSFIRGCSEYFLSPEQIQNFSKRLIKETKALSYDIIIVDLGSGLDSCNLDLLRAADEKILVTSAEPTCVERTYKLIEGWIFQHLKHSFAINDTELRTLMADFSRVENKHRVNLKNFLTQKLHLKADIFAELEARPFKLVVNNARNLQDQDLGFSLKSVCKKYYNLRVEYLGFVDHDNAAWQSLRKRRPLLLEVPFTPLAGQFHAIGKELLKTETLPSFYKAVI